MTKESASSDAWSRMCYFWQKLCSPLPLCVQCLCFYFLMHILGIWMPSGHVDQVKSSRSIFRVPVPFCTLIGTWKSLCSHLCTGQCAWGKCCSGGGCSGSPAPVGSVVWITVMSTRQCLVLLLILEADGLHPKAQNLSNINCSVRNIGRFGTFILAKHYLTE